MIFFYVLCDDCSLEVDLRTTCSQLVERELEDQGWDCSDGHLCPSCRPEEAK